MRNSGIKPDGVAFIGVSNVSSQSRRLVNEGRDYFNSIRHPKIDHFGWMARVGLVQEAMEFVKPIPIEPNPVTWWILIGACKVHGYLELGERITKDLIDKELMHSSNYVLLSSVYTLMKHWENKMEIRKAMSKRGIQKVPGCSLLELDGEIYEFVAGDESHPHYKEIYEMVVEIGKNLRREGYVATISEMMLDLDEEYKEDALHWHSEKSAIACEKLAIAFALLRMQIRIVKNLHVCGDCHSATKLMSKDYW